MAQGCRWRYHQDGEQSVCRSKFHSLPTHIDAMDLGVLHSEKENTPIY